MAKKTVVSPLTLKGFLMRWAASLVLIFATFNPSGTSYFHWVKQLEDGQALWKVLVGLLLLAGYTLYLRATARSLGRAGTVLLTAIFAALMWLLMDYGLVAKSGAALYWVGLFMLGTFLTIGLTGSFIWRRITGQYDVDAEDAGG
jgi:hypothetical protein